MSLAFVTREADGILLYAGPRPKDKGGGTNSANYLDGHDNVVSKTLQKRRIEEQSTMNFTRYTHNLRGRHHHRREVVIIMTYYSIFIVIYFTCNAFRTGHKLFLQ